MVIYAKGAQARAPYSKERLDMILIVARNAGYSYGDMTLPYEILPQEEEILIRAKGKTRAGLFNAAVEAVFAAMKPLHKDTEAKTFTERSFDLDASDPEHLLAKLVNEAIIVSTAHQETCHELKLDFVTEQKVKGHFVGCSVNRFERSILAASEKGLEVKKNEATGEWEAQFVLDV